MQLRVNNMNRIIIENKESCCGCTACSSICPKNAIVMKSDKEGFSYPHIIEEKCINCGLCAKVCQTDKTHKYEKPIEILAANNKNIDVRMKSSSGGFFPCLADLVEQQHGVIYGASFTENFQVVHERAEKRAEWERFRTSKYVQSDLQNTFVNIQEDLANNRKVLFVGTPCQVEGLKLFLQGKNTDKLITCDLVCHGVPSPRIWADYLKYVQKNSGRKIGKVNFRDKGHLGWHNSTITFGEQDTDDIILEGTQDKNFYFKMFFTHLILRPSCYKCKFANMHRVGDVTIGDFWGIEKSNPEMDDNKGTSLLLLNTKKGRDLFETLKNDFEYIRVEEKDCLQPNLCRPSFRPKSREMFWRAYHLRGLEWAGKRAYLLPATKIEKVLIFADRVFGKVNSILLRIIR